MRLNLRGAQNFQDPLSALLVPRLPTRPHSPVPWRCVRAPPTADFVPRTITSILKRLLDMAPSEKRLSTCTSHPQRSIVAFWISRRRWEVPCLNVYPAEYDSPGP